MRDRLSELVRQRALVSEHLAWLDREIASVHATLSSSTRPPETSPNAPTQSPASDPSTSGSYIAPTQAATAPSNERHSPLLPTAGATPTTESRSVAPVAPEELIEQYRVSPATVKQDVRKGCLLYFTAAFVVLGIVVAILYFTIGAGAR